MDAETPDMEIPVPPWFDMNFVQKALRVGENDPTLEVTSCKITMANAAGDGYASDFFRAIAVLKNSEERRVVVKCLPQGGMREDLVKSTGLFERETHMLAETLPALHKLLNNKRPGKYQPFAAKCLYHGNDPVPFIVLEDLRHSGFTMAKRNFGVDLAHTSFALKTLARLHASSLALLQRDPKALQCYDHGMFSADNDKKLGPFFELSLDITVEEMSKMPEFKKYAPMFKKFQGRFYDCIIESCRRKEGKLNVLLHGDLWTNNMMFRYNGEVLEEMRLVDFQNSYYSCVAIDLYFFLYTCPTDEVRIQHMDNLIQEYHSTLVETLELLDVSGISVSLEDVNKTLDDYAFYGLSTLIGDLAVAISDGTDGFDFEKTLKEEDEGKESLRRLHLNPVYLSVLSRLLPLFESKGAFDI